MTERSANGSSRILPSTMFFVVLGALSAGILCRPAVSEAAAGAGTASAVAGGANYEVKTSSGPCKKGAECVLTVEVTPKNGYHANKDYPHKCKVADNPKVKFKGEGGKPEFSVGGGSGTFSDEKVTIKVKFTPEAAGDVTVSGEVKSAVCSGDKCEPFKEAISASVKVS